MCTYLRNTEIDVQREMISIATCFYNDGQYKSCCDVCLKYLKSYPNSTVKEKIENFGSINKA